MRGWGIKFLLGWWRTFLICAGATKQAIFIVVAKKRFSCFCIFIIDANSLWNASDEHGCQALSGLPISFVYIKGISHALKSNNKPVDIRQTEVFFLSLSCFASLSLILLLPFLLFLPQCDEYAYRERERRTKRAKVKVFCKVFAYRRLLLSSSVRWVTQVKSSSSSSLLFSQLAVRRNESMLFNLAPLT